MKPLDGIRVLDLSHVLAMPYATMILADLGAEVIKIERPGQGDDARQIGPFVKGESGYFMSVNRNKFSVELDLKHARGKEILAELIKRSDVIAENYRPGALTKLGFSYDAIKALNPKIIYATVCGFGHDSVYSERPGYDIVAQAFGGLMSITGEADGPPTRVGTSVADIISGLFTAIGVLGALRTVEATGQSERLDLAMSDCILAVLENAVVRYTLTGNAPSRVGSRHPSLTPFDVFRTADGYVVIAAGNDTLWSSLCAGIPEFADMLDDPRFASNASRTEHQAAIKARIEAWSRSRSSQEVADTVAATGVPCSPVNTVDQVVNDPNTAHRHMLAEFNHPVAGHVRTANNPISYLAADCKAQRPAPVLGQHTAHVLTSVLGYTRDEVKALRADGVIGKS